MTASNSEAAEFPCELTINIPFPTQRLATIAFRSISVDKELSPLVRRSLSVITPSTPPTANGLPNTAQLAESENGQQREQREQREQEAEPVSEAILEVVYRATTNRMLRVAVNGFFESIGVVLQVMAELDVDVVADPSEESLQGVQGLEAG